VTRSFIKVLAPVILLLWASAGNCELVERLVAIVNDDAITLSELDEAVAPYEKEIGKSSYGQDEERQMLLKARQEILSRMIDQKLTDQETARLGVLVDDTEVDRRIEQIKNEHSFTEEELKNALSGQGFTMEEYRKRIKEQMLSIKLINLEVKSKVAITEDEIREYYEKHQDLYGSKAKYHLRSILVEVPSWQSDEDRQNASKKIQVIMEALENAMSFEEAARQYSEAATARDGGDLGLLALDELTPELQEAVRWMRAGDISPALETPHGYQILYVEKIEGAAPKTLKDVRIEIQEKMYREIVEQKYKAWLEALRKRSYIKVIQ